ncbi:MAG: GTPase, partial [Flavobacteriales bacterium]
KLFATLDTTVRKIVLQNVPFLMTDTVGFIRKLPHQLVESFKSTLDEVREADLIVHLVDVSHPEMEEQFNIVNKTLKDIEASDKPSITVFNKIDKYSGQDKEHNGMPVPVTNEEVGDSLAELKQSWMAKMSGDDSVFISAERKQNIGQLIDVLYENVKEIHKKRYPYDDFLY